MPLTLDQIIDEATHLPREQMAEIVDRLTSALRADIEPAIEVAWKSETRRRLEELEKGSVQPVSPEAVSSRIRKIVGR